MGFNLALAASERGQIVPSGDSTLRTVVGKKSVLVLFHTFVAKKSDPWFPSAFEDLPRTVSSGDDYSAICGAHLGPFGISYYGANQERSRLEIEAQFHVQARFVHSLQSCIFQPQLEDSL